jgi:hypothetical protein
MPIGRIRKDAGVRCDRSTNLGNPFDINDGYSRDQVCDAYQRYFGLIVKDGKSPAQAIKKVEQEMGIKPSQRFLAPLLHNFLQALYSIKPTDTLLCWCHPLRCHTWTIEDYIRSLFHLPPIDRNLAEKIATLSPLEVVNGLRALVDEIEANNAQLEQAKKASPRLRGRKIGSA